MINIRPVSDLRNKYLEIEELVLNEDEVEHDKHVEKALDEAEMQAENPNTKYLSHEEVFSRIRGGKLNGEEV